MPEFEKLGHLAVKINFRVRIAVTARGREQYDEVVLAFVTQRCDIVKPNGKAIFVLSIQINHKKATTALFENAAQLFLQKSSCRRWSGWVRSSMPFKAYVT